MIKTFIHVGFLKTGSTFLQKNIFSKLRNIKYVHFNEKNFLIEEFNHIQTTGDLFLSERKILKIKKYISKNKNKDLLISSENLSGSINTPSIGTTINIPIISKRLKKIFKNPQIIIFLRNQKDMIISSYKDDVAFGYSLSFEQWLENKIKLNSLNYFFFYNIIKFYFKEFGKKNVHIFFYENTINQKYGINKFIEQIGLNKKNISLPFTKIKENESQSDFTISISKFLNRLIKTKLNSLSGNGINKNLIFYNLWRYKISKLTNKINFRLYDYSKSKLFTNYLKKIRKDNVKLSRLINKKLPKNYFKF